MSQVNQDCLLVLLVQSIESVKANQIIFLSSFYCVISWSPSPPKHQYLDLGVFTPLFFLPIVHLYTSLNNVCYVLCIKIFYINNHINLKSTFGKKLTIFFNLKILILENKLSNNP